MKTVTTQDEMRDLIGHPHELVTKKLIDRLDDMGRRYIDAAPLAMLSTCAADGAPDVTPRGDAPGFVHIVDDQTLLLPERPGNKLAFALQNILVNPNVALLFMIPGVTETYRVHGTARLVSEPAVLQQLAARGKPALLAIEVRISRCFLHCGKALMRSNAWTADPSVGKHAFRFGSVIAREAGGGAEMETMVNQIVEEDYRDNLY